MFTMTKQTKKIDDMMKALTEAGHEAAVGIVGHVRPDGDCVGSTTALYSYLKRYYPEVGTTLYLEYFKPQYARVIPAASGEHVLDRYDGRHFDILFILDCADANRIGVITAPAEAADFLVCIDHHVSNGGFANVNIIDAQASSACQVLYELLDADQIDRQTADSLMLGIVHDTGVFRHQNTSSRTMEVASALLAKGAQLSAIVNETYFQKTFEQLKITGTALNKAYRVMDNRIMCCVLTQEEMAAAGAGTSDLDGIVDSLRGTDGIECAVFLYQTGERRYKVSLRSNRTVNVSEIAAAYGGGGHVRAAGFTKDGTAEEILEEILAALSKAMA